MKMAPKTDKNILKQYFRSGSRPTQNQFYELIDSCYNDQDTFSSFASGYDVVLDTGKNQGIVSREAGRTFITPVFDRINTTHLRTYHYALPVCHMGDGFELASLILEVGLPENRDYTVKDKTNEVKITQVIKLKGIKIYNGGEELFTWTPTDKNPIDFPLQLTVNKPAKQWRGISIDLEVEYAIKSDIAVSDQLNIPAEALRHVFGFAGCIFKHKQ